MLPLSPTKGMPQIPTSPSRYMTSPLRGSSSASHSASSMRRTIGASGLPPPPIVAPQGHSSQYSQSIAKSLTIDEMRQLHQRALSDAESKQTELRLVLASRYRELVGSSDEVQKMRERAQELNKLVHALPTLLERLNESIGKSNTENKDSEKRRELRINPTEKLRHELSSLPRNVHRFLDENDVHGASVSLIQLFQVIAQQTQDFPLATVLAPEARYEPSPDLDLLLKAKMKMVFLYTQALPEKIVRISKRILYVSASFGTGAGTDNPSMGAMKSAAALSALDLLDIDSNRDRAVRLLDMYFDAKAQLLQSLLNQMAVPASSKEEQENNNELGPQNAEEILSKIVLILQHDVVLHPFQIFCLRKFPIEQGEQLKNIMKTIPVFDQVAVKTRCSNFLAAHLPLIRTKVKSILVSIAGTTASALGKIRQLLYDITDGVECIERLDSNGVCTWEEAVQGMVDVRAVLSHGNIGYSQASSNKVEIAAQRRFSLWSSLFSNTFSSLVHSLLTTSFHSVHARVVSTLRTSLVSAPSLGLILPHEAYRNTLRIATELDEALLKVSDDAHELLVHAEERTESEQRLRLSLYVQTCEIMGRLVLELRQMVLRAKDDKADATKELIVGRLCHLLKFRLTALPTLLDPKSSPAVIQSSSGMISLVELQGAFELADDNDDGLITFEEAMEAVDSSFSGTQFHGAEMVRETLLLSSTNKDSQQAAGGSSVSIAPVNVTIRELALLAARGLRHESAGAESALGTFQKSLDDIIESCFEEWARSVLCEPVKSITGSFSDFLQVACTTSESEWRRIYYPLEGSCIQQITMSTAVQEETSLAKVPIVDKVSPHIVGYLLDIASILNRTVFSSDSFLPVHSLKHVESLGLVFKDVKEVPTMKETFRWAIIRQALFALTPVLSEALAAIELKNSESSTENNSINDSCPSALTQLKTDISFIKLCFYGEYAEGLVELSQKFDAKSADLLSSAKEALSKSLADIERGMRKHCNEDTSSELEIKIEEKHHYALVDSDMFLSALFKGNSDSSTSKYMLEAGTKSLSHRAGAVPLLHNPLASSRRFALLPIQSSRSISEAQLRGKLNKERQENDSRQEASSAVKFSSGLGFFSSMLKTK